MALGLLTIAPAASAQSNGADESPTAYIGDDLEGLTAASLAEPRNIGLRMRVIKRMLAEAKESTEVRKSRLLMDKVQEQLQSVLDLKPEFIYVYRVLAEQYYRTRKHEKFLEIAKQYENVRDFDYDMRSYYVKTLLRLASSGEDPQPERKKEAARYVGDWFDSGLSPVFGTTVGACAAWLIDPVFRDELIGIFERRYQEDPKNLNLVISYAACLSILGRNESAWKLVHEAERVGLCDTVTGGRHPVAYLLDMQCPEIPNAETYKGFQIDELEALSTKFKGNASFSYRSALVMKKKAFAAEKIAALSRRQIRDIETGKTPDPDAKIKDWRKRLVDWEKKAKDHYVRGLPHAVAAKKLNPSIEAVSLLSRRLLHEARTLRRGKEGTSAGDREAPLLRSVESSTGADRIRGPRDHDAVVSHPDADLQGSFLAMPRTGTGKRKDRFFRSRETFTSSSSSSWSTCRSIERSSSTR